MLGHFRGHYDLYSSGRHVAPKRRRRSCGLEKTLACRQDGAWLVRFCQEQAATDDTGRVDRATGCIDNGQLRMHRAECFTQVPSGEQAAQLNVGKEHIEML